MKSMLYNRKLFLVRMINKDQIIGIGEVIQFISKKVTQKY